MTLRAGSFSNVNITTVVVCLLLSISLAVLLISAEMLAVKKSNDEIRVDNWEYAWVSKPDNFNSAESNWQKTTTGEVKNDNTNNKYLHLRTEIESGRSTRILSIRNGNNLMDAEVDGERVLEQLGTGDLYSGASKVEIMLEPTGQTHKIDLYVYAPSVLRLSASVKRSASINLRDTTGILLGALLIGASIALFLLKKDGVQKSYIVITGVSCLFIAFCAFIGQSGLYLRQLSTPVFYKILVVFLMISAICMQYLALKSFNTKGKMNWMLYVSALFPLSFLISPNHSITLFIFALYGIWSAAFIFLYIAVLIINGVPDGIGRRVLITAFLTEAILQSLYWLSYIIPFRINFLQSYLFAAGVGMVTAAVVRRNALYAFKAVEYAGDIDDLYNRIARFLYDKADTNKGHLKNVSSYVRIMCRHLKMPDDITDMVSDAALLHDIGKIALPKVILEKEKTVDKDEYEQLRSHVLHGYNILVEPNDTFFRTAALIAMYHHERYDGSGYLGKKGKEIDLYSRITSIADTFDALTSSRSYKKAWSFDEAYDYINAHAGDYFDPELVKVFNACRNEIQQIYQRNNPLSTLKAPANKC